ncbi:tetratricopeptide repeat protein [Nocardioides sp.]|uniref:antitoxin VbhA family protein n=1 Tax=Nocardioides sp. TaxID=35761 RepID=UPI003511B63F
MSVTFALVASSLGYITEAEGALAAHQGPLVDSFRGYLYVSSRRWQDAVHHLRRAVSDEPADADALLNLSIALWNLGSKRKATRAALRATRTAPGRKDISLHYLELLLAQEELGRFNEEIERLEVSGIIPDGSFLTLQARARLTSGDLTKAASLLQDAMRTARRDGDRVVEAEAASNLAVLRFKSGKITRDEASSRLAELVKDFSDNDAVVMNYAEMANSQKDAAILRGAMAHVMDTTTPVRRAYLRHQLAVLEGNIDEAAEASAEWFELEPNNRMAAVAAVIAIGIGKNRLSDAMIIADHALDAFDHDPVLVNNAAYVFAMGGRPDRAIALLKPFASEDFVLMATLGLAYLAKEDIETGMSLYRKAADIAEKVDPALRSLMTAYQALIVRQLGIDRTSPQELLNALALVPYDPPEDWKDRPDFLRLERVCRAHGYPWPLAVEGLTSAAARDMAERQDKVADAVHSGRLEGHEPSAAFSEDANRFVHGVIDADEVVRRTRERYGLS